MNVTETKALMLYTAEKMVESEPYLTELDLKIGDGDHGLGMQRGFAAVRDLIKSESYQPKDIGELFLTVGTKMMSTMGGASGAIFGTLFRAGGKGIAGESDFNAVVLARLLAAGEKGVFDRGGAKPGDKTMMDALAAATQKAQEVQTLDLKEALNAVAQASAEGAERTKDQVAVFGRAKSLGERSLGYVDPGAVSTSLILRFMGEYLSK